MDYKAYALMAILLASVASVALVSTANAQTTSVTVQTDNTSYSTGDDITISGTVTNVQEGQPVFIRVNNPLGALARADPVTVAADGTWTYTFPSGGPLMQDSGEYTVQATYRGITEETTFDFEGTGEPDEWIPFMVNINGTEHEVGYKITGGTVEDMTADVALSTLLVSITSTADGTLELQLPRDVMQALSVEGPTGGQDIEYIAFADSIDTIVEDIIPPSDAGAREISIDFEQGTEEIEVVGTWIVPEFGAIAAIVLAVAIVGIIVATARYGKFNSFTPRL